jgi:Tfp pilus assembly protein PilF
MIFVILTFAIVVLAGAGYYFFYIGPRFDPANRAAEFIKNKRYEDAILEYRKILDEKPFDFITHYRLANLYLRIDEIDQAAIHLERVIGIDKYNYEVDKLDVQKKLAEISASRDDLENTFRYYYEIVRMYPTDHEALYNVAFILLGQEEFDLAQKYFDRLVKGYDNNFEIMFGAGVCSYQNQKINEAVIYFKNAVNARPESEIANLAMTMSLIKKRDYRPAQAYTSKMISLAEDPQVRYISLRCSAYLDVYMKHFAEGVKKFEEVLEFARKNEMQEEIQLSLYDMGFACIRAEFTKRAYDYWNELFSINRNYKDIGSLIMMLRREMESSPQDKTPIQGDTVHERTEEWLQSPLPADFLWGVCSLRSDRKFDIRSYIVSVKVSSETELDYSDLGFSRDLLEKFLNLETENFRIIANRVVGKIGYKVDQIMTTYRESDGIDFMATRKDNGAKAFVWVRRWKQSRVGEIPLRNFAQMVNDMKASEGLFITTASLTEEAEKTVLNLTKVKVILPDELNKYLQGLI